MSERGVPDWLFAGCVIGVFVAGVILPIFGIALGAWLLGW